MDAAPTSLRLSDLAAGQHASVKAVHSAESLGQRLSALGFRAGKPLTVMRRGSLAGPLQVRLGTTDVILRLSEAAQIEVTVEVKAAALNSEPA